MDDRATELSRYVANVVATIDWPEICKPRDLGRFNCRGDYVFGDGRKITAEEMGNEPNYR